MARQLAALTRYVFGKRSDQTPPRASWTRLWRYSEKALHPRLRQSPAGQGGSRKGRQTRAELLPGHLPLEETILMYPRVAAGPGTRREISRVSSDRLERIPGKLIILAASPSLFMSCGNCPSRLR